MLHSASKPSNELRGSVALLKGTPFRRAMSFFGPALLVSVGYMDPGNWATDLAGGSRFGFSLLWVILLSNLMAILLQTLCVRLGIATGRDLAQECRSRYSKPIAAILWILCEIAIIACDVAEVIGSAVALQLLFRIPLVVGVVVTGLDVLLLLGLMKFGFRRLEALVGALVLTIGICFLINLVIAGADYGQALRNLVPNHPLKRGEAMIAIGILGATVMPHNLYLHSSIVQSRAIGTESAEKREAIKASTWDTIIALMAAFLVNAAILVLAATVFFPTRKVVEDLGDAHGLIQPVLGGAAATLFAVALLAAGQSSTITGTLAGQIVMEGFTEWRLKPAVRRLITRGLAIVPAMVLVGAYHGTSLDPLILSQVVLSIQLPFAIVPLIVATSDRRVMGEFVSPKWLSAAAWTCLAIILSLNVAPLILR